MRKQKKRSASLFLALALFASTAMADPGSMFKMKDQIEDSDASVEAGYERIFDDGKNFNQTVVELQFYGIKRDGAPNVEKRWFSLEASLGVRDDEAFNSLDEGTLPNMAEVSLIPLTYTKHGQPESRESDLETSAGTDEFHHRIGEVQFIRNIPLGIDKGIRIKAYGIRVTGEGLGISGYVAGELLGYALEQQLVRGEAKTQHVLNAIKFGMGLRLMMHESARTKFFFDVFDVSVGAGIPLAAETGSPHRFADAEGSTGLSLEIFKSDYLTKLAKLKVSAGARGRTGDESDLPDGEEDKADIGYAYVNASLVFYLD